jgi:pseudaminic acid synthase
LKTFVVAEISANHNNDYDQTVELIQKAKEAGADAVKLQTYTPDTITLKCDKPDFQIKGGTIWDGRTLYDLYEEAHMPWEWQPHLKRVADSIGIELFSTPFDKTAVDFLESIGVQRYKIASFELVDIPLIKYVASKKKPIIMSTGMATLEEIEDAVEVIENIDESLLITLLKCTSNYPSLSEEMNLNTILYLADFYDFPIGLSDHTLSLDIPMMAVALGATVIEKHITLSRKINTPDKEFSLEPDEFKQMVDKIRLAEKIAGEYGIVITEQEKNNKMFRRSLYVVKDIKQGDKFTEDNIRSIRPAYGLPPKYLLNIIGKTATQDIERGEPLKWKLIG